MPRGYARPARSARRAGARDTVGDRPPAARRRSLALRASLAACTRRSCFRKAEPQVLVAGESYRSPRTTSSSWGSSRRARCTTPSTPGTPRPSHHSGNGRAWCHCRPVPSAPIYCASGNSLVARVAELHSRSDALARGQGRVHARTLRGAHDEHEVVFRGIRDSKPNDAEVAMRRHIREGQAGAAECSASRVVRDASEGAGQAGLTTSSGRPL